MLRPNHLDNFGTNLTSGTSASDTTSPVNSVPSIAVPFWVAFDATNINSNYERKLITSKTATNILHSALSYDHTTAEEVRIVNPAAEFDAIYQPPQGYLINGKIVPSVASNNLTVALKTLAGADPSETDPVFVRIGDSVQMIVTALSVTLNAGTNYFNAGSTELATKEIDYFSYLCFKASDSSVVLGFSRIPSGAVYSDFSGTNTNEKYWAGSATPAATDVVENIGRFAATLSAGAGYTWSVPTFTSANLIQRPIYETRALSFVPVYTSGGGTPTTVTPVATYKIVGGSIRLNIKATITNKGTATGAIINTLPMSFLTERMPLSAWEGAVVGYSAQCAGVLGDLTKMQVNKYDFTTLWTTNYVIFVAGTYEI